jgi:hypothetical protein
MEKQQQKKNIIEHQRKAQADLRLEALDAGITPLITAPPASTFASINMLQLSPPARLALCCIRCADEVLSHSSIVVLLSVLMKNKRV